MKGDPFLIILITGALGGIGRAPAVQCANKGARIGIHYNGNKQAGVQLLSELAGDGHSICQL